jgi:hypothetical protein
MTTRELIKKKSIRLQEIPDAFLTKIDRIQKQIFTDLIAILESIDKQGGFLVASADNLKQLSTIFSTLKDELFSSDYVDIVASFGSEFDVQKLANEKILADEFKDFSGSTLGDALVEKSKEDALQALLGAPLETEFLTPLDSILSDSIATGASWKDTVQSIRDFVEGNDEVDGKLLSYSKQIAHDAFAFSDRSYTSAVSDELESEWFLWSGGELPTSRCVCIKWHDKYFHYKELEAFGRGENLGECKSGDLWAGAVPDTNEKTIFIYAGGFGCIHSVLPVSVFSVPKDVIERNISNGNYQPSDAEAALVGV